MSNFVLIGLGSNKGPKQKHIETAICDLDCSVTRVIKTARFYESSSLGVNCQENYINTVVCISTFLSPDSLFRKLKQIEALHGRRGNGVHWDNRTIDLDIIDYKGRILNWSERAFVLSRKGLVLPHLQLHARPFVLEPIDAIYPNWRHPVFKMTAKQLLKIRKFDYYKRGGDILRIF